jgi:hypothetical protein
VFPEQQAGNKKTTQHKKQINTRPSPSIPGVQKATDETLGLASAQIQVTSQNQEDSQGPQ